MERNAPVEKIVFENVVGTIWINSTESNGTERKFATLKLENRYRNGQGEWKSSNNFTKADVRKAINVLQRALEYMEKI